MEKQADEKKHNVKNPKQVKRHRETQRERERFDSIKQIKQIKLSTLPMQQRAMWE